MLPVSAAPLPASDTDETAWDINLAGPERRAFPRRAPETPCWLRVEGRRGLRVGTALLRDVSRQGAGLLSLRPLEVGEQVYLQPLTRRRKVALFSAVVVHVTPADGGWLCGCDFLEPLDDDELKHWLA